MLEERAYWLAWAQIPGLGPVTLRRLHNHFGSLKTAWELPAPSLKAVEGIGPQLSAAIQEHRRKLDPPGLLREHLERNPQFWTPADPDYPPLLREIPDPPPLLYYRGQPALSSAPTVGVVGTRDPSDYGRRWTERLTTTLTHQGFTIVSGLALGIDAAAHHSCLAAGGHTWAVLGTGVDQVYPASHQQLSQRIANQGLLLSEYPRGTKPDKANFPQRNRIIAALSRAVLVLEAPSKSGALITARLANEYGRDVYALPGSLDNPRSLGCLELIAQGAQLILGEDQLLEALGGLPALDPPPPETITNVDPQLQPVWQVLTIEPQSFDQICQATGLPADQVSSTLIQLELFGLATQLPGLQYRRGG